MAKEELTALIKELVQHLAGKGSEAIVDVLFKRKEVDEFKLAEKLGLTINQARNILYKLSDAGIVSATRRKEKKKGWYIYFWTLDLSKALKLLLKIKQSQIATFQQLLESRKLKTFYECTSDGIEMAEETAMLHNFFCPECGQLLQPVAKERKLKELSAKIEAIEKSTALIKQELEALAKPKLVKKAKQVKKIKPAKKVKPKSKKVKKK